MLHPTLASGGGVICISAIFLIALAAFAFIGFGTFREQAEKEDREALARKKAADGQNVTPK